MVQASSADYASKRPDSRVVDGIDLRELSHQLDRIDYKEVAKRRHLYNRLYHEALLSDDPRKGMSFSNMLLLLAHYKFVPNENALQ